MDYKAADKKEAPATEEDQIDDLEDFLDDLLWFNIRNNMRKFLVNGVLGFWGLKIVLV